MYHNQAVFDLYQAVFDFMYQAVFDLFQVFLTCIRLFVYLLQDLVIA